MTSKLLTWKFAGISINCRRKSQLQGFVHKLLVRNLIMLTSWTVQCKRMGREFPILLSTFRKMLVLFWAHNYKLPFQTRGFNWQVQFNCQPHPLQANIYCKCWKWSRFPSNFVVLSNRDDSPPVWANEINAYPLKKLSIFCLLIRQRNSG
jgi:hypothetical protein